MEIRERLLLEPLEMISQRVGIAMKHIPMMMVGMRAPIANFPGLTPPSKYLPRIYWPAGLGALAMTVRPPPVTAPATTAYFEVSASPGTRVAR